MDIEFMGIDILSKYSLEEQQEIQEYLSGMDEMTKKCCCIAYQHLGSSFNILRSNGFKEWKALKKKKDDNDA